MLWPLLAKNASHLARISAAFIGFIVPFPPRNVTENKKAPERVRDENFAVPPWLSRRARKHDRRISSCGL
jgi:hypothetical protein